MQSLHKLNSSGGDTCESLGSCRDFDKEFTRIIVSEIVKILQVSHSERDIITRLLYSALEDKICLRDGLLEQYLHTQLDTLADTFKSEYSGFNIPDDTEVNYNYATHAKFKNIIDAVKKVTNYTKETKGTPK